MSEIMFEIDNDLRTFFSSNGLKFSKPSMAHEITDIITYCNSTSRSLKMVTEKDISKSIESALSKRLSLYVDTQVTYYAFSHTAQNYPY
jgi:hypothetical protein